MRIYNRNRTADRCAFRCTIRSCKKVRNVKEDSPFLKGFRITIGEILFVCFDGIV